MRKTLSSRISRRSAISWKQAASSKLRTGDASVVHATLGRGPARGGRPRSPHPRLGLGPAGAVRGPAPRGAGQPEPGALRGAGRGGPAVAGSVLHAARAGAVARDDPVQAAPAPP